ncbi:MAG: penicillin-insensitive murein endopeptidase [Nannocystaceae bacterium]
MTLMSAMSRHASGEKCAPSSWAGGRMWFFAAAVALTWLALPHLAHAGRCGKGHRLETHVVAAGETLARIARGYDVGVDGIRRWNPKVNPNLIRPGQKLRVCIAKRKSKGRSCRSGSKIRHRVKKGENLSTIAQRYAVTEKALLAQNPRLRKAPDRLRTDQVLTVCSDPKRVKGSKTCGYRMPLFVHEVIPGEWASEIAGRYGVRRRDLYRLNPKLRRNPNLIRPGQRIRVCPEIAPRRRQKFTHSVRSGQTFGSIAKKYGLTMRELQSYQQGKLADRDSLRVGQKLIVWRDGALVSGYGAYNDNRGVLRVGVQLPPGRHYVIKHASTAWGTSKSVRLIQKAAAKYSRRKGRGPKVHIGDISRKRGGKFPPHLSHQHGRDVDVGYILRGDYKLGRRFNRASKSNLDVRRSWMLIKAFLDTDEIRYIFMDYALQRLVYEHLRKTHAVSSDTLDELFQYPRGRHRAHGIIRHSKGHVNHFHVRFRR